MSDYLDPQNEELLKDFFDEANLQVDLFEQNILTLERDPTDNDAVDEMFRAAHTLKGAAATVQMQELASFTHIVEDVLDDVRSQKVEVTNRIVEVLLQSIDIIKEMLGARTAGNVFDGGIEEIIAELKAAAGMSNAEPDVKAAERPKADPAPQPPTTELSEYEVLELQDAKEQGDSVYKVTVEFDESNPMNTVGGIQVFAALKEYGKVVKTTPDFDDLYEDRFYPTVAYYVASPESAEMLQRSVGISEVTLSVDIAMIDLNVQGQSLEEKSVVPKEQQTDASTEIDASFDSQDVERIVVEEENENSGPQEQPRQKTGAPKGGSILRVDSKRIDTLLNLVSEAVINKASFNQITQIFGETEDEIQTADVVFQDRLKELFDSIPEYIDRAKEGLTAVAIRNDIFEKYSDLFDSFKIMHSRFKASYDQFGNTAQNLGRITGELQEGVMEIRMVPISQIFSRFPRLVRDVSKNLNKSINLVIEGQDTELDKSVIEDLLDPLIHCVRNAVDHGIEIPEERESAGKDAKGKVLLKASNEGNLIVIEISDDGKGVNVNAIHEKAVEKGLIHPSKQLSEVEAFNLIFEPGFSTTKAVTDLSGRGVGLDVVKKQIEKLNGNVSVWSEVGVGTRITIKLPLTLAIIQGLLVRVGLEVYALPITSVLESHRIMSDDMKFIDNYEVMNVRDEVVSLLRLGRLFGVKEQSDSTHIYVVVVGSEENKVGLIVDSLIGEEDVVIKPLKDRFTNSPGIAGATILGDGKVALIVDVSQLLDLGLARGQEEFQRRAQAIV